MSAVLMIAVSAIFLQLGGAEQDTFNCFLLFSNHYLEKSGSVVIKNVQSTSNCLQHCLLAPKMKNGLPCRSVMWKRNTKDCILSRWSVTQRPSFIRISRKSDVDLYENVCFEGKPEEGVYSTQDVFVRTTTKPDGKGISSERFLPTPSPVLTKIEKEEQFEFRRFRAHHARSVIGSPLPSQALHVVDRESVPPPVFTAQPSPPPNYHKRLSGGNQEETVVVLPQIDDTNWVAAFGNRPIRPGKITPHFVPVTQPTTHEHDSATETERTQITTTTPRPTTTTPYRVTSKPTPCFGRIKSHFLPNFEERTLIRASIRQCLLNCLNSTEFLCASANYNELERTCILNGGNVRINRADVYERKGWDYFENKCHLGDRDEQLEGPMPAFATKNSKEHKCFERHDNLVMASLDAMVVRHVESLGECLVVCQTEKVPCLSVNWIPSTNGCMLFHEHFEKNDLSPSPGSSFFVNKCSVISHSTTAAPKESSDDYYDQ